MSDEEPRFRPYRSPRWPEEDMLARGRAFFQEMGERRSVRHFSPDPVPRELVELAIATGIACGLFVAALHHMGLTTLAHTPSPMAFLAKILARPENERPFILFPIGYPALDAQVPDIERKPLDEVAVWDPGA